MWLHVLTNREDKQNVNSNNALSVRMVLTYQASMSGPCSNQDSRTAERSSEETKALCQIR